MQSSIVIAMMLSIAWYSSGNLASVMRVKVAEAAVALAGDECKSVAGLIDDRNIEYDSRAKRYRHRTTGRFVRHDNIGDCDQ